MRFTFTWHSKGDAPGKEYYLLEEEIFAHKFAACPSTYDEFRAKFVVRYLLGSCTEGDELRGYFSMLELLPESLYYVRAFGVVSSARHCGVGTHLLRGAIERLPAGHAVAFMSRSTELIHIFSKYYYPLDQCDWPRFRQALCEYNPRLAGRVPNTWISEYYPTPEGTRLAGLFTLLRRAMR